MNAKNTRDSGWFVHKFGGTSVANAERYRKVAEIMTHESDTTGPHQAIVVSAMSGVTDKLIELTELAKKQDERYRAKLEDLKQQHLKALEELGITAALKPVIDTDFTSLGEILRAVWLGKSCSEETVELVSGHGEIWSAQILNAYLQAQKGPQASRWLDARQVLTVRPGETGPIVDWETSKPRYQQWIKDAGTPWVVITGFVASRPDGVATTLKRNGSDFSASIFGALADARAIVIWTDVDGVLSADPRRVPEAVVLEEMSYSEAVELAYFGAKVLHPHTMAPALMAGIPIWIRNTFNSAHPGTKIHRPDPQARRPFVSAVKGFSTVDKAALINLEGTGMIGVPGVANRLFGAIREVGVSVIMISQASSEHSICFAVPEAQADLARETVEKAFFSEIHHGQIQAVQVVRGCSILAAVGDDMVHASGVSAKFFGALGRAGINIRAIAQGSSERNISVVIDQKDSTRALRAVHAGLYLSDQTLSVGIIGPGLIGSALLKQFEAQAPALRQKHKIDLRVRGILRSGRMLLTDAKSPKLEPSQWPTRFEKDGIASDLDAFVDHIQTDQLPHAVLIDCTSSEEIAGRYVEWLKRGIHVVTPNKKAGSGPFARYAEIQKLAAELRTQYFYEATVGAGLPVITTLRDLVRTGDRVTQIEGVLSGTLSFLFNTYDGKRPFSEIVADAKAKGYTEPDPRDDLSGLDVARKLIILAREMGLELELKDIAVESLVPAELTSAKSADEFMAKLPHFDERMAGLAADASAAQECLRYVGQIHVDDAGRAQCSVRLRRYPLTHSFARISGSDNIIAFRTQRYHTQPLIVQGPGAGPEVTAGGVFGDLLRLTAALGTT